MLSRPSRQLPPWEAVGWLAEVEEWVDGHLEGLGLQRTGPMEPRERPWSIVMRVPTSGDACWFKTTAPAMANDAGLTQLLAAVRPDLVLAPVAVAPERRWMLLPDGGTRMRDRVDAPRATEEWLAILPSYATLQRSLEGREDELLAAGALDRRPGRVAPLLEAMLHEPFWLQAGEPEAGAALVERLGKLVPPLARAAEELAGDVIGCSIQHDDLHDGNVLYGEAGPRLADWGDASVAHPFGSLLVTLRVVGDELGTAEWAPFGDLPPELARLRDAYLEPWTDRAPRGRLLRLFDLACWTGMVARALTWRAALPYASDGQLAEFGHAIPAWLAELADARPG
jgi:hypothetical protein